MLESGHGIHFLHSVLLTNLLLDDLKRASPSRIIVVSSKLHDSTVKHGNPPNFKWTLDEINNAIGYDGMVAYKNSKLANVWFSYELARRLENTGVDVHVLCPVYPGVLCFSLFYLRFLSSQGFVPTTGLGREANFIQRFVMSYILTLFPFTRLVSINRSSRASRFFDSRRTEAFGSDCEVFAATSDTLSGRSGVFMSDMKETKSSDESYDTDKAKRLWTLSEQWTHLSS